MAAGIQYTTEPLGFRVFALVVPRYLPKLEFLCLPVTEKEEKEDVFSRLFFDSVKNRLNVA